MTPAEATEYLTKCLAVCEAATPWHRKDAFSVVCDECGCETAHVCRDCNSLLLVQAANALEPFVRLALETLDDHLPIWRDEAGRWDCEVCGWQDEDGCPDVRRVLATVEAIAEENPLP